MARKYYNVPKKTITLDEYWELRKSGAKRPFCSKGQGLYKDGVSEIVRVELKCKRCGKVFYSQFSQLAKRSCLDLCTTCINHYRLKESNAKRDSSYYENPEYRKKISAGVKAYYKRVGKSASQQRMEKRFENFEKNHVIPNFGRIRMIVNGINCESFGEAVFVKWKLSEGYSVSRCDFYIEYEFQGEKKHYIPDFKLEKDGCIKIVEVKCDYKRNFQKSYEALQKRVEEGLQVCNNLQTYRLDILEIKLKVLKEYCENKKWDWEMITLDDPVFDLYYNRAKRHRRNGKTGEESIDSIFRKSN